MKKILLMGMLVIVMSLCFIGCGDTEAQDTEPTTEAQETTETQVDVNTERDIDGYVSIVDQACEPMRESGADLTVTYDEEIDSIVISCTWEGITAEAAEYLYTYGYLPDSWYTIEEEACNITTLVNDSAGSYGCEDVSCTFNLMNDYNSDKVLLSVMNGNIAYSLSEDY